MTPAEVAELRGFSIVDIRPFEERLGELGFLPGSRSVPCVAAKDVWEAIEAEGVVPGVVLCCTSGRRSGALLAEVRSLLSTSEVEHLEGGVLAWRADGFPVAFGHLDDLEIDEADRGVSTAESFRRVLLSCFVAEATELAFDKEIEQLAADPLAALRRCYDAGGVPWDESDPTRLYAVVDRASAFFRRLGGDPSRIAANVTRMYGILGRVRSTVVDEELRP
ncbi:MAG: hypothetical protein JNL21_40340 [Myxococcales bacterium]|nr:hypothetical protein [Myxococcales bacterium]